MKLGYVELAEDPRYANRGEHSGIVFTDLGRPYQGSQVALENARAVGRVIGVEFSVLVTHRLRRPAMDETGAELIVSGTAPSAQRSGFAWCEKPVC